MNMSDSRDESHIFANPLGCVLSDVTPTSITTIKVIKIKPP